MSNNTNKYTSDVLTNTNSIVKIPRSTFKVPHTNHTAFNGGKLIPLDIIECYPGDTVKMSMSSLVRISNPLIKAPMGEVEFAAYAFKVPMRILLEDFEEIIANYNPQPDWFNDNENTIPGVIVPGKSGFAVGSVADYMGLPVNVDGTNSSITKFSRLPFNAYVKIGDEWFRDEDLMNTAGVNIANADIQGVGRADGDYLTDAIAGGALYPVCKLKSGDPFSTARPGIQKGSPVVIGLGGEAPVRFGREGNPMYAPVGIKLLGQDNPFIRAGEYFNIDSGGSIGNVDDLYGDWDPVVMNNTTFIHYGNSSIPHMGVDPKKLLTSEQPYYYYSNLNGVTGATADLSQASPIAISELRLAFQLQKIKEINALYGNRYPEYLQGRWGVRCADGRLQIPEFLGSQKFVLNINQTVQTSTSSQDLGGTPQGNIASYSMTHNRKYLFETSCVEHCYIMIVGCCRIKHRPYSQGVPHLFLNRARDDFYVPELANISAQPIKNAEIYYGGTSEDNENFGYKEAFWWMRIIPNKTTGLMRPNVDGTLSVWNLSDNYNSLPTLSPEWIIEDMSALDRALTVPSSTQPSFLGDFLFDTEFTRPIPVHSYPGLVDHQWGYRS